MTAALTMPSRVPVRTDPLSREEILALSEYEQVIERGLKSYIEVGTVLGQIRENRLYRNDYATFEEYCQGRWDFNRHRASQLIGSLDVVTNVTSAGLPAPANEGQARALSKVPADQQADVLREARERTGGKPTAKAIREVAEERKPEPKKATPGPSDEQAAALPGAILKVLTESGSDRGLSVQQIWTRVPMNNVHSSWVQPVLEALKAEGRAATADDAGKYWIVAAAPEPDITPDVLGVLRSAGASGLLAPQIAFLLDPGRSGKPTPDRVRTVLHELADAGQALVVGQTEAGSLWALTGLVDQPADPEIPEEDPAEVPIQTAPAASPELSQLKQDIARDSERRAAAAGIRSVLTYMTSRVLSPDALAHQYVIALAEFDAEQLRFAARTLNALADLKEQ